MSRPLLCVTVTGRTSAELKARRDAVPPETDLVEIRLDTAIDPDVATVLADRQRRVILTCRPKWEGGWFAGSEEERHRILSKALALGADYVDIEWRAGFDDLVSARGGHGIVLSMHDFSAVPEDLAARFQSMRATGAEVVKLAVTAGRLCDTLPLLELGRRGARYAPTVVIAMGDPGIATRVLAARFGSCWTYAGEGVAPGQLSAERLLREYSFRRITEHTEIYGVVGSPVMHSVSPAMHNAAFKSELIDAVYLPFAAADVDDFLLFASACGLRGASVTVPFKVEFFDRVDEPDAVSRRIGAVNTIRHREGRWQGTNTDVAGFLGPLRHRARLAGARAAILGAGGAARAVGAALVAEGSLVTIYGRNAARVEETARRIGAEAGAGPEPRGGWDLLINATPVGMTPNVDDTPYPSARFDGRLVYDLVYNPTRTRLLHEAEAAGCETIGGLDMLVAQAQQQAEWWTGHRPAESVLREAALHRLQAFQEERHENHVV